MEIPLDQQQMTIRSACQINLDPLDIFCNIWIIWTQISGNWINLDPRPRCQSTKRVQQRQVLDLCASMRQLPETASMTSVGDKCCKSVANLLQIYVLASQCATRINSSMLILINSNQYESIRYTLSILMIQDLLSRGTLWTWIQTLDSALDVQRFFPCSRARTFLKHPGLSEQLG